MQSQGLTYIEPKVDNVNLGNCFVGRTLVRQPCSEYETQWDKAKQTNNLKVVFFITDS
jgi:hypothetical protein